MKTHAILFDLYGTLFAPVPKAAETSTTTASLMASFKEMGLDVSSLDEATLESQIWDVPVPAVPDEGTLFENRLAGFLNTHFDIRTTPADVRETADRVCAVFQQGFVLDPGCHELLSRLKRNHTLAMVSNFDHSSHVRRVLSDQGLANYFSTIVVSGDTGVKKPDPRIMEIAFRIIHAEPGSSTYVGDSIVDYEAATAAGMRFIWVRRPEVHEKPEPDPENPYNDTDARLARLGESGEITIIADLGELVAHPELLE